MTVVLESWRRYLFEFHGEEIIDRLLRLLSLINGDGGTLVRISDYFMGSSPKMEGYLQILKMYPIFAIFVVTALD